MEEALDSGNLDVIGLGRPLCTDPDTPRDLMEGTLDAAVSHEKHLRLANKGFFSPASPLMMPLKVINVIGGQAWYYQQIFQLADSKPLKLKLGVLRAFKDYFVDEISTALRVKRPNDSAGTHSGE